MQASTSMFIHKPIKQAAACIWGPLLTANIATSDKTMLPAKASSPTSRFLYIKASDKIRVGVGGG